MEFSTSSLLFVCGLFFVVAMLYASVGHGGASGYLAILSFFAIMPKTMSTTALILTLLVSALAFISFYRAGHFSATLTYPFLLTSVPAAFLGGMIHIPTTTYALLLAGALCFAAFRLIIEFRPASANTALKTPGLVVTLPIGAAIGLLSGIVGVGGGIFLSPVILLMHWADPKKTSATSACFIFVNALAGLAGRFLRGNFEIGMLMPFLLAAIFGGMVGSHLGANLLSGRTLQRVLGVVLIIAAYKLIVVVW